MFKDRFLSKVIQTENCWWWSAGNNTGGYGQMNYKNDGKRTTILAHRASWLIFKGPIPKGKMVTHKCDHRFCVNPDHLKIGDQKSNMRDMVRRGHSTRGELNIKAKLTKNDVIEIRNRKAVGFTTKEISERYKIGLSQVNNIVSGRHWKHIPFPQEKGSESPCSPSS